MSVHNPGTWTHTVVTAGAASVPALPNNPSRVYALLFNDSSETLYLKFGAVAVAHEGIAVGVGGAYEMTLGAGNLYTGQVNVISSGGASKKLLVTEGS